MRAGRLPAEVRRAAPGSHIRDNDVQIRHDAAYGRPVRPQGVRLLLHAPGEPDERPGGEEDRRAGRRRSGDPYELRAGGLDVLDTQPMQRRRPRRVVRADLRRDVQPVRGLAEEAGDRVHVRRPRRFREGAPEGVPPEHEVRLRRDGVEPVGCSPRHREVREGRSQERRAAHRRQHVPDPDPVPSDRVRLRHRDACDDEVHGRSLGAGRRVHRRLRELRLDEAC